MVKSASAGARARLRQHFLENIGRVMDTEELRDVAGGISEWARRVRELRTEEGYQILTHNDRSDLKPGQYLLLTPKPEPAFERSISKETRAFVLDRNGFTCQMCGAVAGEPHPYDETRKTRLHIGHIIDKSMGGVRRSNQLAGNLLCLQRRRGQLDGRPTKRAEIACSNPTGHGNRSARGPSLVASEVSARD